MPNKKRILVVEDNKSAHLLWSKFFVGIASVSFAFDIEQAKNMFLSEKFDIIVMDCCVPGHSPNTMDLVVLMRQSGFKGPILANSSVHKYTSLLILSGASHSCTKH